jgi:hypothetical protein
MDNLETNSSPGGEAGATASQGQLDAIETQPTGTEAGASDTQLETEGKASNPWDNDPKFKGKSPEDIYKAYKEAEKLSGQLSQKAQIANLIQEKYGVTPEQLQERIAQQEQEAKQQYYANNPMASVLDEVSQLRQIVERQEDEKALMAEEQKLDGFLKDNPEYQPFRDKILKLGLSSEQDKSYEEIATEWFGQARAQGQEDAYKKIDTKKMTQATGSQGSSNRRFSGEDMDKMSAEELRSILPIADISNRPY